MFDSLGGHIYKTIHLHEKHLHKGLLKRRPLNPSELVQGGGGATIRASRCTCCSWRQCAMSDYAARRCAMLWFKVWRQARHYAALR